MKICCKTHVLAIALFLPVTLFAQAANSSGKYEATKMVRATVLLTRTLDADKDQPNSTFEAKLVRKVTLSDGTVLPEYTTLTGKVTTDDMNVKGTSKLALCFDQARLKDGKVVPIKATIVDITTPGSVPEDDNAPNTWTNKTLVVDQISVMSDLDLHSNIASNNSGVFVSTKKHDVKLPSGSQLQLAIGPAING